MYHIIIGVDDDTEHALACVEEVANLPGDPSEKEVTLVHSFTENPSGASATQLHSVREASEYLEDHGIAYDVNESSGNPADVIVEFAEKEDADLIVTAGRKRSPAGKALFGSVTQSVILNSDRPVMVTGETKRS
ncbi:universal stress protein [Haloferax sp. S1W]|uniref:universal stress protein n=1 Tax=Haloferax sp. S1W TaxID=3377110 RepID=UPI0037C5A3C2